VALFTPDLELFDLERFEVLRGPQGTLFGAGSEAGTVRYITRQPKLGALEAQGDASFEDLKHGDQGGSIRGAVNLPIGSLAAARLVGYYHHLPGFIDAIQPGGHIKRAVNDGDRSGARLAFLFTPTDELSITPRFVFQNLKTNGYPRVDIFNILANPYTTTQPAITIGDRQQYTQAREGINDDFALGDLKVDYTFGPATVTSITSFTNRKVTVLRDATQLTGSITYTVLGLDGDDVRLTSLLYDRTRLNVISEELRVASAGSTTLQWVVGGFYQHIGRRYGQDLPTPGYDALTEAVFGVNSADANAPPDTPFYSDLSYKLTQWAGFGEATYNLGEHWSFTGGLRYYSFKEDRVLNFAGVFADLSPPGGIPGSTSSNGTSPRVIVSYKVNQDLQFNAQAARGFRLGGINDPINVPLCQPQDLVVFGNQKTWKDEHNWNYEIGAKMRFPDLRATLNIAAFYDDIKDLQATTTAGTCSSRIVFNVPKARVAGVEAELFARPTANWDLGLSATYVNAKLKSSVVSTLADGSQIVVGGLQSGNRLPTAPEFQAVAYVGFTFPLESGQDFFATGTVQYVGSSFSQFEQEQDGWGSIGGTTPHAAGLFQYGGPLTVSQITFNPELPSYSLGNVRAGFKTQRWEVALYCNNLWDKTARLALDTERDRRARVGYLTNQPRTIGLYGHVSF
jgi:iron complex outermembrane receptor protein